MQLFVYPSSVLAVAYLTMTTLMLIGLLADPVQRARSSNWAYMITVAILFATSIAWILVTRRVYHGIIVAEKNLEVATQHETQI